MAHQSEASCWEGHGCQYVFLWACVGFLAAIVIGLIGGLTRLVTTDYKTDPLTHGALVALGLSCVGIPLGALSGSVLWLLQYWRAKQNTPLSTRSAGGEGQSDGGNPNL